VLKSRSCASVQEKNIDDMLCAVTVCTVVKLQTNFYERLTTVHSSVESLNNRHSCPVGGNNVTWPIARKPLV